MQNIIGMGYFSKAAMLINNHKSNKLGQFNIRKSSLIIYRCIKIK